MQSPPLIPGIPFVRGVARFVVVGTCLLTACFSPGADTTGSSGTGGTTGAVTGSTSSTGTGATGDPTTSTSTSTTSTSTTTQSLTTGPGTSTTGDTTDGTDMTTTGTSSSTGSDSSSGGPVIGCGDGVVAPLEQCDDGNTSAGDGCDPDCQFEYLLVFVTSEAYSGQEMGGALGGDAKCKKLADAQPGLTGRSFAAWLSTGLMDAEERIGATARPYRLTDKKTQVADNTGDLLDGSLDAAISRDEKGAVAIGSSQVWTGTTSLGLAAANHCSGWSQAGMGAMGMTGDRTLVNGGWTEATDLLCNELQPIYCVEKAM